MTSWVWVAIGVAVGALIVLVLVALPLVGRMNRLHAAAKRAEVKLMTARELEAALANVQANVLATQERIEAIKARRAAY